MKSLTESLNDSLLNEGFMDKIKVNIQEIQE